MKRLLSLFGLLDIVTLIRSYRFIIPPTLTWKYYPLLAVGNITMYVSLVFSALFLIRQKKIGLLITYGQFPLRLAYVILSFGFLFEINRLFDKRIESYMIIFWVLIGLEVLRLTYTIIIHRKYFSNLKSKVVYR